MSYCYSCLKQDFVIGERNELWCWFSIFIVLFEDISLIRCQPTDSLKFSYTSMHIFRKNSHVGWRSTSRVLRFNCCQNWIPSICWSIWKRDTVSRSSFDRIIGLQRTARSLGNSFTDEVVLLVILLVGWRKSASRDRPTWATYFTTLLAVEMNFI